MIEFVPDHLRDDLPETRPDDEGKLHKILCHCAVCKRPSTIRMKQRYYRAKIRKSRF